MALPKIGSKKPIPKAKNTARKGELGHNIIRVINPIKPIKAAGALAVNQLYTEVPHLGAIASIFSDLITNMRVSRKLGNHEKNMQQTVNRGMNDNAGLSAGIIRGLDRANGMLDLIYSELRSLTSITAKIGDLSKAQLAQTRRANQLAFAAQKKSTFGAQRSGVDNETLSELMTHGPKTAAMSQSPEEALKQGIFANMLNAAKAGGNFILEMLQVAFGIKLAKGIFKKAKEAKAVLAQRNKDIGIHPDEDLKKARNLREKNLQALKDGKGEVGKLNAKTGKMEFKDVSKLSKKSKDMLTKYNEVDLKNITKIMDDEKLAAKAAKLSGLAKDGKLLKAIGGFGKILGWLGIALTTLEGAWEGIKVISENKMFEKVVAEWKEDGVIKSTLKFLFGQGELNKIIGTFMSGIVTSFWNGTLDLIKMVKDEAIPYIVHELIPEVFKSLLPASLRDLDELKKEFLQLPGMQTMKSGIGYGLDKLNQGTDYLLDKGRLQIKNPAATVAPAPSKERSLADKIGSQSMNLNSPDASPAGGNVTNVTNAPVTHNTSVTNVSTENPRNKWIENIQ